MKNFEVERMVPDQINECLQDTYKEHLARYIFAANFVNSGCVGLDIACGTGYGTDILVRNDKAAKFHGIDISPDAIEYAKRNFINPKLNFVIADINTIDYEPSQFDLITSFETIEHLDEENGKRFLKMLHDLLKDNGTLIVSCPNKDTYPENRTPNRFHLQEYSFKEIFTLLNMFFPKIDIYCQQMLYFNRLNKKTMQFLGHLPQGFVTFLTDLAKKKYATSSNLKNMNMFYRMILYQYHFESDVYPYIEDYNKFKPAYFVFVCKK